MKRRNKKSSLQHSTNCPQVNNIASQVQSSIEGYLHCLLMKTTIFNNGKRQSFSYLQEEKKNTTKTEGNTEENQQKLKNNNKKKICVNLFTHHFLPSFSIFFFFFFRSKTFVSIRKRSKRFLLSFAIINWQASYAEKS